MIKSTRSNTCVTASDAILKGLSEDGGLFVFDHINPHFYNEKFVNKNYLETTFSVFKELLDNFCDNQIRNVIKKSYNTTTFSPDVVTLETEGNNTYLKLFNGNTFAFKDVALSALPNLYSQSTVLEEMTNKTVILTATSGDTGSAALSGFQNIEDVYVIVLYPATGVSTFQELQMNSFASKNCFVIPVDGNFDDCQNIVKELFTTTTTKHTNLSSANSINIGRIIPQIVYYVYAYSELVSKNIISYGDKIDITVPTGNFGNIYAAYVAKKLGVPIENLIIASNNNNVLTRLFREYVYDTKRDLKKTISPSMDILISSNLERYLYHLCKGDYKQVKSYMNELQTNGKVTLDILKEQTDFHSYFATEHETKETIKNTFENENIMIDPHTAVARCCVDKFHNDVDSTNHMLIASTASPFKFVGSMLDVFDIKKSKDIYQDFQTLASLGNLEIDPRMMSVLETTFEKDVIQKEDAASTIRKIIGEIDDTY
jgi:threonine synthase